MEPTMKCLYLTTLTKLAIIVSERLRTRKPLPSSLSAGPGSSQALGLGLGGKPESGLSSPLSALQLISSGSPSHTFGKFNLPTISS